MVKKILWGVLVLMMSNAEVFSKTKEDQFIDSIVQDNILDQVHGLYDGVFKKSNHKDISFSVKADGSIASELEKQLEKKVGEYLKKATPWAGFVGEEGYQHMPKNAEGYVWYMDPIDGTISFKNGLDTFAMTLTLAKGTDPLVTIIYFPNTGVIFKAYKGRGAFKNDQKISISDKSLNKNGVLSHSDLYAFEMAKRGNVLTFIKGLGCVPRTYTDIHGYTLVSDNKILGKFDAAGALWDLLPGFLLVREAGGDAIFYFSENPTEDLYGSMLVGPSSIVREVHSKIIAANLIDPKDAFINVIPGVKS